MKIFTKRSQIVCLSFVIGTLALLPSVTLNAGDLFADVRPSPLNPFASHACDTQSSSETRAIPNPFRNATSEPTTAVQHNAPNAVPRSPSTFVEAFSNFGNITPSFQVSRQTETAGQTNQSPEEAVQLASASEPVLNQDKPVPAVPQEGVGAPNQSLVRQCFADAVPPVSSLVESTREPPLSSAGPEPPIVGHLAESSAIVAADDNNNQLIGKRVSAHTQVAHEALPNEVSDATVSTSPIEDVTVSDSAVDRVGASDLVTAPATEYSLGLENPDSTEHHQDLTISDLQPVANTDQRTLGEEQVATDTDVGQPLPLKNGAENGSPLNRQHIIFRPGVPSRDSHGRIVLQPKLNVADGDRLPLSFPSSTLPTLSSSLKEPTPPSAVEPAAAVSEGDQITGQLLRLPSGTVRNSIAAQSVKPNGTEHSLYQIAPPSHSPAATELPPPQMPVEELPTENISPSYDVGAITEMPSDLGNNSDQAAFAPATVSCADPVGCEAYDSGPFAPTQAGNTLLDRVQGPARCNQGALGAERVMYAPFFIEATQPLQNCGVTFDFAWNEQAPDRIEYFWAATPFGRGPQVPATVTPQSEPSVDYQDFRFFIERGSPKFSVATELPIRMVDPEIREATGGFADMNLTTKAVLLDGRRWKLSQTFRTYFPTGAASHGTGNGHFSLEPGVAYQYKINDLTYFHGDLKYWFPLGEDPRYSGQFLNYGIGISHVAIDRDNFAVIPTFEAVAWSIPNGAQTPDGDLLIPDSKRDFVPERIPGMNIVNLCPGVRFVWDNGRDCGVREIGISSGIAVTENHWYENILRVELRWSY